MTWGVTKETTLNSLKNKSLEIRQAFAKTANAALSSGKTEDEAIFAGMQVVSQIERKKDQEIKKERQAEAAKPLPWHLQAIQESAEIKKQQRIQEEFQANAEFREKVAKAIQEGALDSQQEIASLYFDTEGKLVILLSDGKAIKSKNSIPEEVINQYISVSAPSTSGEFELPEEYDHIQFNLDSPSESTQGRLVWNAADGTLDLGMGQSGVVQQVGLETYFYIKNQTGSLLTDGTVVMATGAVGNSGRITVSPAIASPSIPSIYTIGIVTHDIPNGTDGFVTNFGLIRGVDTRGTSVGETWADGDILYVHPTQPGKMTKIAPVAPIPEITVAMVIKAHQNGSVFVRPTYRSKLGELDDVKLSSVQHGEVLKWDSAEGVWKNQPDNTSGDAPETNAVLTYGITGDIIRIDYSSGNYKLFSYNLAGELSQLDYIKGDTTYRKTYNYTDGVLTSIIDSIV